jgi:hypothetical protein
MGYDLMKKLLISIGVSKTLLSNSVVHTNNKKYFT